MHAMATATAMAVPEARARSAVVEPRFADDPGALPEGSSVDGARARRPVEDEADFVVVGSGAAGATAALCLAERGYSVRLLEEGPWVRTRDFSQDLLPALGALFRGAGSQVIHGRALVPLLQGRCVGGSTVVNSAIAWRPPGEVLRDWRERFGVTHAADEAELEPHFAWLERELSVRAVDDDALGENSALFGVAAARLGMHAQRIQRYDGGCRGSAGCMTGCRHGAKLSMAVTFVPRALALGARVYYDARVERVELRGGRAVGVLATMHGADGPHALRVRARRGVFVAASTVQSPNVLRRSGVRSRALGRHFQAHPGVSLAGAFDRPVRMDHGAAQGYNSLALAHTDRIKLETVSLPPELIAPRLPGFGDELMARLSDYERVATWAVVVRAEAEGTVGESLGGDRVKYTPGPRDMERARKGLRALAEMMFAAGAREVYPGVHGMPAVLKSADELGSFDRASTDPRAYSMIASHLFGAARMGPEPRAAVVGNGFECHEAQGLYVVDSSVFPTNIGVNPQHTIMALARLAAARVADRPHTAV